ncbi:MAG: hypothetical protein HYU33_03875 [Candidatus Omnitrophica bacterium]|nr:hypothetical protein [Candidatus Omnitrophota bacterium]MBI3010629.1 hypothetical protein [Candidatus Omnitrophota bacterium]
MSTQEIQARARYLFLTCVQMVDRVKERLVSLLPESVQSNAAALEVSLRRELGLLFRYWATQQIWQRMALQEKEARMMNIALLRLFTEELKLPRDGSGLRYAQLGSLIEETREFKKRVGQLIGFEYPPLTAQLEGALLVLREELERRVAEALQMPLEDLSRALGEKQGL